MGSYYFLGDLWLFSPEAGTRMFSLHFALRWRHQAMEGEQMHILISLGKRDAQKTSYQTVYKLSELLCQAFTNIC